MRRSDNSRGRGRGFSRPSPRAETPVYTDHLRDLDLELDMLRRQREIIQQKQALLNKESQFTLQRQNVFSEPSSSFDYRGPQQSQFNNNAADFSHLYNSSNNNKQNSAKRPAKNWQDLNPPKRPYTQTAINPWASSGKAQDFHNVSFRQVANHKNESGKKASFLKPFVKPRTDFKPSKITKPKAQTMPLPNKLQTYPPKEAKKLVAVTVAKEQPDTSQILRPDVLPTLQMTGRLELALGQIVKDVKKKYCHDLGLRKTLQIPNIDRLLKTTVRSRINDIMMNKNIGHFSTIIKSYREKYPEHTDEELIYMIKNVQINKPKEKPETDPTLMAIKAEVLGVLDEKLNELFQDLSKLSKDKDAEILERIDELPDLKKSKNTSDLDDDVIIVNEEGKSVEKKKDYTELIGEIIEQQLPKLLPKYKFTVIKMLMERGVKGLLNHLCENTPNNKQSNQEKPAKSTDSSNKGHDTTIQKEKVPLTATNKDANLEKGVLHESTANIRQNAPEQTFANATPQKQAAIVTPQKPAAIATPQKPAAIATPQKPEAIATSLKPIAIATLQKPAVVATPQKPADGATPQKTPVKPMLPYYVKLFGRPNIPSKAVIYEFLNKYNPASIKKHKSVNNLLVIGFTNKDDFINIVAANETVVGDSTLFIKASEQVSEAKVGEQSNDNIHTAPQSKVDSTPKKMETIAEDDNLKLNEDINNLLSTIRKVSEKDAAQANEDMLNEGGTDPQDATDNENGEANNEVNQTYPNYNNDSDNVGNEEIQKNNDKNIIQDTILEADETKEDGSNAGVINEDSQFKGESNEPDTKENVKNKSVLNNLKETGRATPTRSSSRLANVTPSTIKTRRSSKLEQ